jgi:hypothetical protein
VPKRFSIFSKWIRIPRANEMKNIKAAYFRSLCVFIIQRYITYNKPERKSDETENQDPETTRTRIGTRI